MKRAPKVLLLSEIVNSSGEQYEECGLVLSADFTAEHEFGIKELNNILKINEHTSTPGIARRSVTVPINQRFLKFNENVKISVYHRGKKKKQNVSVLNLSAYPEKDYSKLEIDAGDDARYEAYWSWQGFEIFAFTDDAKAFLRELYEAMMRLDFAVWTGGSSNPFGRGGLILAIPSRVAAKHLEMMANNDIEQDRLTETVLATGIVRKLHDFNIKNNDRCHYFALSPKWITDNFKNKSKFDVMFWLNPFHQDINNSCWCTVEELEQWMAGTGPIIKSEKKSQPADLLDDKN